GAPPAGGVGGARPPHESIPPSSSGAARRGTELVPWVRDFPANHGLRALGEREAVAGHVPLHDAARGVPPAQKLLGKRVLQHLQDGSLQRSRTERRFVAEFDQL